MPPSAGEESKGAIPFDADFFLVKAGSGLATRGTPDSAGVPAGAAQDTIVVPFNDLGALDSRTILVHAVHMLDRDWTLAAKRRCTVVFCPRSNSNMNSGRPDIEKALKDNTKVVLPSNGELVN